MSTATLPVDTMIGAYRRLSSAQKSAKGAPPYSRYVNRRLGRLLAAGAHGLGLRPNQVTVLSATATFAGIAAVTALPPSVPLGLGIAALLVIGYALDSADGQLARLRGGGSLSGEWLDHMIDSVKVVSLHLAVLVGTYRFTAVPRWWLVVPLIFAVVSAVHFFGMILNELMAREQRALTGPPAGPPPTTSAFASLIKLPTDYGVLCVAFALLGWTAGFDLVYTVLAAATLGYTVLAARRWFANAANLDRERSDQTALRAGAAR